MNLYQIFSTLKSHLNGDFAYQKYLEHHQKNHPNEPALDKKSFLKEKEKRKWDKVNRCC